MTEIRDPSDSQIGRIGLLLAVFGLLMVGTAVGLAAVSGTVAAQDGSSNQTATQPETTNVTKTLDSQTRINRYSWSDDSGRMTVVIENTGGVGSTVFLVEVVEAGAESWEFKTVNVGPGETVRVRLQGIENKNGEPAVMVATRAGIRSEQIAWLTTGEPALNESATTLNAVGLGIVTAIVATGIMGYRRYNSMVDRPEPVDEEL